MAEKLSQSQIDALLNAVRSGEKELTEEESGATEKKYRKYDFSSPRKFTKDRVKMLQGIYDGYARVINTRLNARLRTNCEISVESVEEQRYYEFANALTEGDVLALADVKRKGKVYDEQIKVHLSALTVLSMMDRLMGGEGETEETISSEYNYTDLELRLYEVLIKDLIMVMGSSWENYIDLDFAYDRIDVNPTMSQTTGLDEIVVIVVMKMKFPNFEGGMSICLPGDVLNSLFGTIGNKNTPHKASAEKKADEIFDSLRESELEVVAELGNAQLTLNDIYHLNVGDVIDIGTAKTEPVVLKIGGYRWFNGYMGTHKKNLAVKIDSVKEME